MIYGTDLMTYYIVKSDFGKAKEIYYKTIDKLHEGNRSREFFLHVTYAHLLSIQGEIEKADAIFQGLW